MTYNGSQQETIPVESAALLERGREMAYVDITKHRDYKRFVELSFLHQMRKWL